MQNVPFPNPKFEKGTHSWEFRGIFGNDTLKTPLINCSNPKYPHCNQCITTLCDWEQVQNILLPLIHFYRNNTSDSKLGLDFNNFFKLDFNNFFKLDFNNLFNPFSETLDKRMDGNIYNNESTLNTLRYLFYHMKCGIFVMIRNRKIVIFAPFVNKDYENNWSDNLQIPNDYYLKKQKDTRVKENIISEKNKWWANGNIVCNVSSPDFWGDAYLVQLFEMIQETCSNRNVSNVEFFINKRDFPQLKSNRTEPYDFLFPQKDTPLTREIYSSYTPVLSFFVSSESDLKFADLPLVTTDDWKTAMQVEKDKNNNNLPFSWNDKIPTAVFRGSSTGPGTNKRNNQRLLIAELGRKTSKSILDAGIVSYNIRDRKLFGEPLNYIKEIDIPLVNRIPMKEQSKYKYQIYIDGHCAAMRYGTMMSLGSTILKVESLKETMVADSLWFFSLLKPFDIEKDKIVDDFQDHVLVKSDLSNLLQVIKFLQENDDIAKKIAENAKRFHDTYLSKDGIFDYMHCLFEKISTRFENVENVENVENLYNELDEEYTNLGIPMVSLQDINFINQKSCSMIPVSYNCFCDNCKSKKKRKTEIVKTHIEKKDIPTRTMAAISGFVKVNNNSISINQEMLKKFTSSSSIVTLPSKRNR